MHFALHVCFQAKNALKKVTNDFTVIEIER